MPINMGMHPLLAKGGGKRKFRWLFEVQLSIDGKGSTGIGKESSMLPPSKSARPNISFKEYSAEHLNETIYFPGKVEWQLLDVSLYDVKCFNNPMYDWMTMIYNPDPSSNDNEGFYGPSLSDVIGGKKYKTTATITMYNACGVPQELWTYMNISPVKIDWGELDMTSSDITMVDLSLRYDRAYITELIETQEP